MFTPNLIQWWTCLVALLCFPLGLANLYSRKDRAKAVLAILTVFSAAVLVWSAAVIPLSG